MICPICGFDMQEEKTCEKCGFEAKENEQNAETETEVDFEALENLEVNLDEIQETEDAEEDEVFTSDEDLEVDFEEIHQKTQKPKTSKGGTWLVSLTSFIAGVLATLIVVGCLNGTIITYFDKITNGTPYETVEKFCGFYFLDEPNAEDMVSSFSPYLRSQITGELQQYGYGEEFDLNIDVNDDKEFKKVAQYYLELATSEGSSQTTKILSIDYEDVEYYKSGSDEFNTYLEEYKKFDSNANGVSLFANVSFTIKFDVTTVEAEEITPTTTKKNKKNKTETTAPTTTSAPKTTTETMIYKCSVICVKVNDNWRVYNGLQVLS